MYATFILDALIFSHAQQVQIKVSPVSGLNKPEKYHLHLQHTASLSHYVSHNPRGHFLSLILGIPFLLSW